MSAQSFARRFRAGEPLLGALVRMPNEGLVELAGLVGLDYVVIDTEHGPGDQLALTHHLTAAEANGLATVVRIGGVGEALRALDLGAHGILAPHVSSVEQARELVEAVHYPPRGRRGFATYSRAGRYGLRTPREHHEASGGTVVIAMVEDPAGLAAATDIAGLDGVDGLMLGPADFACELGVVGRTDDPRVLAAAAEVRAKALGAGATAVSIVASPEAARRAFAAGDTAVMYNVQHALGGLFTALAGGRPTSTASAVAASADTGRREPLVLLPGMLGDATVWDAVAAGLTDVAAPQFGRIDLDDSVAGMAESVLATAPARFALAGHSLGGIVALEVARRAPDRVTRLALVNASGRGPSDGQQASWQATLDRLDAGGFDTVAAELATGTLPEPRRSDPALVAAGETMARSLGPDVLRRQLRAQQGRTSYLAGLSDVRVPVLVVGGGLDDVCPPDRQRELAQHCASARLVVLDDAGHMAPLERPQAVAAALRAWLTGA